MPRDFWELTLNEFNDLLEGYKWRNEREWERVAQLAVWTSEKLKRSVTAEELLGKKNAKKKTTPEETRAVLLDLTNRLGGGQLGMG
jgi:hypothetical protein